MKKKIMAFLLACTLAAGMAVSPAETMTVRAEEEQEKVTEDGFVYTDNDYRGIIITGYTGNATEVVIPESIDGKKIYNIYSYSFSGCKNITSIRIPDSVTQIGNCAFQNCSSLTSIDIPDGVNLIGEMAFWGCSSLANVSIPDSVAQMESSVFSGTPWLAEQFEQNEGLAIANHILVDADENLSGNIIVPAGITLIAGGVFSRNSNLTGISIPDGVTRIGSDAFSGCSSLTSVNIPDSVTYLEYSVFEDCSSLTNISIPNSVTYMYNSVFSGCSSLVSVDWPTSLEEITAFTFCGCSSLTSVHIPDGVTQIIGGAFSGCSSLTGINIPDSVTYLGSAAFSGCSSLTNISIPAGITEIENKTFSYCSSLTSINIPSGVTYIGSSAFSGCSGLTSISIPAGVTSIEMQTFDGCSSLTSISIPDSVTNISSYAFSGCSSLKDVYYAGSQEQWSKIEIADLKNESLFSATIHYNSSGPDAGIVTKSAQSVTASDITKTYGAKAFSLGAKASGGTALSYSVSDPKVAAVDANGNVTIKGCGITDITITAAETSAYEKAQKIIRLTVKPKTMKVSSVKSQKKKTATVKWKKDKSATGYMIECATDKKFKKNKVTVTVSKYKTVSRTVKKLKAGKKYYFRICAYAKSGGTKVQGNWSKSKTVKVKS